MQGQKWKFLKKELGLRYGLNSNSTSGTSTSGTGIGTSHSDGSIGNL